MARGKTVNTVWKRVIIKGKPKMVKVKKEVVKGKNLSKGVGGGTRPWSSDKAALRSEEISSKAAVEKARIAGRTANIAQITAGATNVARNLAGVNSVQQNAAVDQSILGGLKQGTKKRDEDVEDNPYID